MYGSGSDVGSLRRPKDTGSIIVHCRSLTRNPVEGGPLFQRLVQNKGLFAISPLSASHDADSSFSLSPPTYLQVSDARGTALTRPPCTPCASRALLLWNGCESHDGQMSHIRSRSPHLGLIPSSGGVRMQGHVVRVLRMLLSFFLYHNG
jgi:hypothetical protein